MKLWERFSPLTGLLSVVCTVIGVLIMTNEPQDKDSDAKIVGYFASHSHRVSQIAGFFVFLAGIVLLTAFFASLRERLAAAEGAPARLTAFAFGAGIATLPIWMLSMLLANAPTFAVGQTGRFRLDPNTYRLLVDMAFVAWVVAVAISAIVVWATSAVALRTSVLPRWFGWSGIVVGVVQLFGWLFFPFFVWWIWVVLASALLVGKRRTAPAAVPQPAH